MQRKTEEWYRDEPYGPTRPSEPLLSNLEPYQTVQLSPTRHKDEPVATSGHSLVSERLFRSTNATRQGQESASSKSEGLYISWGISSILSLRS